MTEITKDNPAARLADFYRRAQAIRGVKVIRAFAQLFGVPETDIGAIFLNLTKVEEMMKEIQRRLEIADNPGMLKKYSEKLPRLRQVLNIGNYAAMDFEPFKQQNMRPEDLLLFELLAEHLDDSGVVIAEDELKSLKSEVDRLYEDVLASGLDKRLKLVFLENLQRIQSAIHNFRLWGAEGLQESLAALAVTHELYKVELAKSSETDKVGILRKLGVLADRIGRVVKMAEYGGKMLAWSHAHAPALKDGAESAITLAKEISKHVS